MIWSLFEIVRDNVVPITSEDLQTYEGEQPPNLDASDLRRLATVRVNADGDAEWAVLVPARPGHRATQKRSDVIEPDAERQERAAAERERKATEEKVDWALTRELTRTPALSYSDAARGLRVGIRMVGRPDRGDRGRRSNSTIGYSAVELQLGCCS